MMRRFNGLRLAAAIKSKLSASMLHGSMHPLNQKNPKQQPTLMESIQRHMSTIRECLLTDSTVKAPFETSNKVTIVGSGNVGMACVISILIREITSNVCLIDINDAKIQGELMDLQHGALFMNNPTITASTDFAASAKSHICIITGGVRQAAGETQLQLMQKNTDVMKVIVPQLVKHSPDTILLVVTNPLDIITYVCWKISGLPVNRVIGSGTNLESARFRHLVAQRLGIAQSSVHGLVIGEHGNSCVPLWSSLNVAGVRLRDFNPKLGIEVDEEKWHEISKGVDQAPNKILQTKGYTNWAIGNSVAVIVSALLRNTNQVYAVSTNVCGQHGIDRDLFLSLPCVLNGAGVSSIVKLNLDPDELKMFQKSAEIIGKAQDELKL